MAVIIVVMMTVHLTEAELVRDMHAVLEKVRQGVEVVIEQDNRPVAVIKAHQVVGRKISEVVASLEAAGANAMIDQDFAKDVDDVIRAQEPWNLRGGNAQPAGFSSNSRLGSH